MAINILIKPVKKSSKFGLKSLFGKNDTSITLSDIKNIGGKEFMYGHRKRIGYVFYNYEDENITDVDIVLYNPKKIGRGFIICVLENGNIELVLNAPCTSQDIREYFYMVKKTCEYFNADEFIMDEERVVKLDEVNDIKESIIEWNIKTLGNMIAQNAENNMIIYGGNNPIVMETELREKLMSLNGNELEKTFADYIDKKQQMDVYYMNPTFYKNGDEIMGVYTLTEGVDSVIPEKPYTPFNSGISDDTKINKWVVSLVTINGNDYDVAGYVLYNDLLNNLPNDALNEKYDQSHYLLHGLDKNTINKLLKTQISV